MAEDIREAKARRRRAEGDRVRAIRERLGEKQPAFAERLTTEAQRVGLSWLSYDNTIVSKLELGSRELSIDDTVVIAGVDPDQRGKLWLAWNEDRDSAIRPLRVAESTPPIAKGFQTKKQVDAKKRRPGDKSA